jgi:hypothetical protein
MEAIQGKDKFIQVELSEVPFERTIADDMTFAREIEALIPINFLAICLFTTVAYLLTTKKKQNTEHRGNQTRIPAQTLPCKSCHFYTHHPYLKCAVRPDIAMTAEAIDCSDYRAITRTIENDRKT